MSNRGVAFLTHVAQHLVGYLLLFALLYLVIFAVDGLPFSFVFGIAGLGWILFWRMSHDGSGAPLKLWPILAGNLASILAAVALAALAVATFQVVLLNWVPGGWRMMVLTQTDHRLLALEEGLGQFLDAGYLFWALATSLVLALLFPRNLISGLMRRMSAIAARLSMVFIALSVMIDGGEVALVEWRTARIESANQQMSFLISRHRRNAEKIAALTLFERRLEELSDGEEISLTQILEAAGAHPGNGALWRIGENAGRVVQLSSVNIGEATPKQLIEPLLLTARQADIESFQSEGRALWAEAKQLGHAREVLSEAVELLATSLVPDIPARDVGVFVDAALSTLSKAVVGKVPLRHALTAEAIRADAAGLLVQSETPSRWTVALLTGTNRLSVSSATGTVSRVTVEDFREQALSNLRDGWLPGSPPLGSAEVAVALMMAEADRRATERRAKASARRSVEPWWRRIRIRP